MKNGDIVPILIQKMKKQPFEKKIEVWCEVRRRKKKTIR
jgi:hypothetical protein